MTEDHAKGFVVGALIVLGLVYFVWNCDYWRDTHNTTASWKRAQVALAMYQEAQINEDADRKIAAVRRP